jgi:hypothetical protein
MNAMCRELLARDMGPPLAWACPRIGTWPSVGCLRPLHARPGSGREVDPVRQRFCRPGYQGGRGVWQPTNIE